MDSVIEMCIICGVKPRKKYKNKNNRTMKTCGDVLCRQRMSVLTAQENAKKYQTGATHAKNKTGIFEQFNRTCPGLACGKLFVGRGKKEYCDECTPTRTAKARLYAYGITEKEFLLQLEHQGGACALCGVPGAKWHLDHDHDTGVIRGILCHQCNVNQVSVVEATLKGKRTAEIMYIKNSGVSTIFRNKIIPSHRYLYEDSQEIDVPAQVHYFLGSL